MKLPEKCQNCSKPKTLHFTQIIGDASKKIDLCADCPLAQEAETADAFENIAEEETGAPADSVPACFACGFTIALFRKNGRLGCPECFKAFKSALDPVLPDMHRGVKHRGKTPADRERVEEIEALIASLEDAIQDAVLKEDYERAALIRDEILTLKNRLVGPVQSAFR